MTREKELQSELEDMRQLAKRLIEALKDYGNKEEHEITIRMIVEEAESLLYGEEMPV